MRAELRVVLERYPALARPLGAPEPLGNAGGGSGARLWRYESGQGGLVARLWPPEGPKRSALERIHHWLREAAVVGFVPVPIAGRDGRTVQEAGGRFWEVAPWLPGRAATSGPLTESRLRAGFSALAAFHQALATRCVRAPSPGLLGRLSELEALTRGGFETLERAIARGAENGPAERARRWIALARATAPRLAEPLRQAAGKAVALQPCLRDARPEHFLFEGDRVTGLVDFGAMAVESVAADLARLLAEWVGPDRVARASALSAYATIRPLDDVESALIDAFEGSAALLGGGHWVRWRWLEQRAFDDPEAVARGLNRGLDRLARLALERGD